MLLLVSRLWAVRPIAQQHLQIEWKWVLSPQVDERSQWKDVERSGQEAQRDAAQQQPGVKGVLHGGHLDAKVGKDKRFAEKRKEIEALGQGDLALRGRVVIGVVRVANSCRCT